MTINKVTARFYVAEVNRFAGEVQAGYAKPAPRIAVKLRVVSGNRAPENAQWASATPQGEVTMTVGNPEAAAWFDSMLGRDVAITFEAREDVDGEPAEA